MVRSDDLQVIDIDMSETVNRVVGGASGKGSEEEYILVDTPGKIRTLKIAKLVMIVLLVCLAVYAVLFDTHDYGDGKQARKGMKKKGRKKLA